MKNTIIGTVEHLTLCDLSALLIATNLDKMRILNTLSDKTSLMTDQSTTYNNVPSDMSI